MTAVATAPAEHTGTAQPPIAPPAAATNLAMKLSRIMGKVNNVEKNGYNDFHKYAFAKESDVASAVRGLLADEHIGLTCEVGEYEVREIQSPKGLKFLAVVQVIFTLRDGDSDEVIRLPWLGVGEDTGDKAVYKAYTGAEKFLLLKMFLIPTGDDPEASDGNGRATSRSAEKRQQRQGRPGTQRPSQDNEERGHHDEREHQQAPPADGELPIVKAQLDRMHDVRKQHNMTEVDLGKHIRARYGCAKWADIKRKDYDAIVAWITSGGDEA